MKCSKEVFKALVDISEVLHIIISNNSVYSDEVAKKLNQALSSINRCLPDTDGGE